MKTAWLDRTICYDGTQLRSHWVYGQSGLLGDAIAAFVGPADVPTAHMCDLVDVRNDAPIFSRSMLHFIVEHFDAGLPLAVARQRLLVAIAADELRPACPALARSGNDLFAGEKKLSVSIATASPVSTLIHFAINVESAGTPVPTLGLADLNLDPRQVADSILRRYADEMASMAESGCKVRAVP
jgi:uncharacterized protein